MDHSTLAAVASAIRGRQRVRLAYVDNRGKESERHIEPVRLVHTGKRWYLVAFDLDRDDWRTFRLDRVTNPVATGMRAGVRRGPDPVELVQQGITVDVWDVAASVILDAGVQRARREIAPTVGTVAAIDEKTSRLSIGADDMGWLARFLLGLSIKFEVEGPPELKEELARIGRELVERYAD